MDFLHKEITDKTIKTFYKVYNELGYGFLEKVYENAMLFELRAMGLACEKQKPIPVFYQNIKVGEYFADIIINDCVVIELKAGSGLIEEHEFQLINYLKATHIEVGMLLNFGKEPVFRRKFFTNDRKKIRVDL
jgi:GxxExxY protein